MFTLKCARYNMTASDQISAAHVAGPPSATSGAIYA
jgi:hypothetical protein